MEESHSTAGGLMNKVEEQRSSQHSFEMMGAISKPGDSIVSPELETETETGHKTHSSTRTPVYGGRPTPF